MYLINLTYVVPLEVVDQHLAAHSAYLDNLYRDGKVLMSGRKQPRVGGFIFALTDLHAHANEIVRDDPFHIHGVASYELTQLTLTRGAKELEPFLSLPRQDLYST